MTKNQVTDEPLDQRVIHVKTSGLSRAANGALDLVSTLTDVALSVGVMAYLAMSCAYDPYDAGKIVYSQLSGDKSVKHRHIEESKWLFAKAMQKQELGSKDMKNLFLELGVVSSEGKEPSEDDVSWYRLLDWIEDND